MFRESVCRFADSIEGVLRLLPESLSDARFTHYFTSSHLGGRYRSLNERRVSKDIRSDVADTCAFAAFRNEGDAKTGEGWILRVVVSRASARCPGCVILTVGFAEELLRGGPEHVLRYTDALANSVQAESGHLHDSEDFADQNQKGPQYFKMTGKYVDPAKIRYSEALQEYLVDVEQNPSHLHAAGAVDYTAAWTNYLGKGLLQEIPAGELAQVEGEAVWLRPDLVRVTLFEDPFAFGEAENISRLWSFRRRLHIDDLAHKHVVLY